MPPLISLPIDAVLPQIVSALRQCGNVVLRAPTGAGKTTRVPPAILDAGIAEGGAVLVLQPRRVAARATAARMADESKTRLGDEIGYQTRFDSKISNRSKIICLTEGILLRRLSDDPFLEGVALVVFDEFHERNLQSDLALGMIRQIQQSVRTDLKIVVMSATLDPAPIARYLGDCPAIESLGRAFPVAIEYARHLDRRPIPELAATGVLEILDRTPGDILVFLPGVGEIKQAHSRLRSMQLGDSQILELYGDLSPERQDAVLRPNDRRRIILSTNVAETSLTIEGVTGVVDTGMARISRFDDSSGLDRLELSPISQASADQRAGRAGRTAAGICLRLWPEATQRARPARESPELLRVDLAAAVLQLSGWIEPEIENFPWFEAPRASSIEQATRLLTRLGAIHANRITPLGQQLAKLPLHPRLARVVLESHQLGHGESGALLAALLSERDPVIRESGFGRRSPAVHGSTSDALDRLHAIESLHDRDAESPDLNRALLQSIFRVRDQVVKQLNLRSDETWEGEAPAEPLEMARREPRPPVHDLSCDDALLQSIAAGYPDRLARRREIGSRRGVMVGGRGVRLADSSAVQDAELFACLDVEASQGEAVVRQASLVRREWLAPELIETKVEVFYDEARQQLSARRRVSFDDLVLEESPAALPKGEEIAIALAEAARTHWELAFPKDNEALIGFVNRVRCLREWMSKHDLPACDDEHLQSLLPELCRGRRSFDELRRAPWLEHLRSAFTYEQLQTLDREAPERLLVPSGNRIALQYEPGRPPILAVRIQELFGLPATPRIAGARVPVLLHLLAPNMRPQQITDDLTSFWNNTYQQVRKDLRARYPKHSWPEDPWNAPPQSRPKRKS